VALNVVILKLYLEELHKEMKFSAQETSGPNSW
jgi:hypothetical protein